MTSPELEVDLDAFAANLAEIRRRVAPAQHMLVVKDDAYGHGLVPIVRRAFREGVRWIGAFDVRTGSAVRDALGPEARVFAWIVATSAEAAEGVAARLDLGVGDRILLEEVAAAARDEGATARVHLKIDTGLHRNGVRPEEWPAVAARAAALERDGLIRVVGVWSHISEASDADDDAARAVFEDAVAVARAAGLAPELLHLAASAAAFARPEFRYDLVRIGAFAYGIRSAGGQHESRLALRTIGRLSAPVTQVSGAQVTIGTGAFDGIPSTLGGAVRVSTPGGLRRLVSVGDGQSLVDAWDDAAPGDSVTVFGPGDAGEASPTDLAERIGTIGEELVLRLSPLVPRVYRGGL